MSSCWRDSTNRNGGQNRFYHPPAMRRHRQQQRVFEQRDKPRIRLIEPETRLDEAGECAVRSTSWGRHCASNLDQFFEYTTPIVPAQYFTKTSMRGWTNHESELHPYFVLGDLWESFREWSAYGAGVPLLLNGKVSVVQYYVPSLSGIQLYIDPSEPFSRLRIPDEESDTELSRETSSDSSSSDSGVERGTNNDLQGAWHQQNIADANIQRGDICYPRGQLIFEYLEQVLPFNREPLAEKISVLASRFPELKTYKSCDLSPSSWISVAWYPIYRIPMGPTLQNLDACFLTFHSLATPFQNAGTNGLQLCRSSDGKVKRYHMPLRLSLPIFGLASYKYEESVWNPSGDHESQKAHSLLRAADNWLRLLQVNHPDYGFFRSRNPFYR